ncbi:MAG TPA: sulfite exporter TauE/SafE family protein [Anaerolineales bacterium]|nr:sulfite exporter TauE/SafE family protein [Anaerolineales bacterium]
MKKCVFKGWTFLWRGTAFFLILLSAFYPTRVASAHPIDMYAQTQSIEIGLDGIQIDWKITPGPLLADAIWSAADQNQDGSISSQEVQAWTTPWLSEEKILLDNQPVAFTQTQDIHWPATVDVMRTGEDSIEMHLLVQWPAGLGGKHSVLIHNSHLEPNSLNWFSIASQQGMTFDQPAQNNGLLGVDIYFPNSSGAGTSRLASWNSGTPNLPSFTNAVSQIAGNLSDSGSSSQLAGSPTMVTSALVGLVKAQQFSPLFLIGAFLLSLVLGSLHAMTPGHGKALVGAYLVGSQGRTRDAVFLGTIVTITHTGSVLCLGLVTLIASHYVLPALIAPWLEVISGVLVIGFGINLLIQRRQDLVRFTSNRIRRPAGEFTINVAPQAHEHGPHSLHTHEPHDHAHGHDHELPHTHALRANEVTWKSLLTLGVSGGLVPCPDAIAILLVAVAVNRIPFGMVLILAFSIGLALVLIAIGIAMVQGVRLVTRSDWLSRLSVYAPVVSAVAVSGLGIVLTVSALNSLNFFSSVSRSPSSQNASADIRPESFDIRRARLVYLAPDNQPQSEDQLFMRALNGGTPKQLTKESSGISGYSISPDAKTILYTTFKVDGSSSISAINADDTQPRLVLNCPASQCGDPQWYPDGQKVVYQRVDYVGDSALSKFSIWWLDLQTGKTVPVFQDQTFPSSAPAFSADGKWLSYISPANNTIQIYGLQDAKDLSIPIGYQGLMPEVWSPASDSILFWDSVSPEAGSSIHVRRYILSSGQKIDLGATDDQTDYSASWSPTAEWIAIDRNLSTSDSTKKGDQVWLVRPDGTQSHVILDEPNVSYTDLNWSPDGGYLAYTRYSYDNIGQSDVWMINIQTGQTTMLASGGFIPTLLP